jgi:hypothetical protein
VCFYGNGILIDDGDTMYVVYGGGQVKVSQLAADGLSIVKRVGEGRRIACRGGRVAAPRQSG